MLSVGVYSWILNSLPLPVHWGSSFATVEFDFLSSHITLWIQMVQMKPDQRHQTCQPHLALIFHSVFHFLKKAVYTLKLPSKGTVCACLILRVECHCARLWIDSHWYRVYKYLVVTRLSGSYQDKMWQQKLVCNLKCCPQSRNEVCVYYHLKRALAGYPGHWEI